MRSYEIHTVKDGAWKIDSVFDDRDLALHEATKIDEGSRYSGVRVIEENYDETSNMTTTRTIFRGKKAGKKKEASTSPSRPRRQANHGPRGSGKARKRRPPPQKKQSNILVPVLILLIILFGGVAAMLLLQQIA